MAKTVAACNRMMRLHGQRLTDFAYTKLTQT